MAFLFLCTVIFVVLPEKAIGQCKGFAKRICRAELGKYTHDGNYHAAVLTEGEEAELYKTFYPGQDYRIAICGTEVLSGIEFEVMDNQHNVLYTNRDNDYKRIWDFRLESTQQLVISVRVLPAGQGEEPASGCVAILFGMTQ